MKECPVAGAIKCFNFVLKRRNPEYVWPGVPERSADSY